MYSQEQSRARDWHRISWRGIMVPVMIVRERWKERDPIAEHGFSTSFFTYVHDLGWQSSNRRVRNTTSDLRKRVTVPITARSVGGATSFMNTPLRHRAC